MTATTPEWLTARGGELRPGLNPETWLVLLDGTLHYRLVVVPARNRSSCAITQANNGRRLDAGKEYASAAAAIAGGLEELRAVLGW